MDVKNLEPCAIIGFDGSAIKGLKIHPDGDYIVYPMGNKVCMQEWKSKKMYFLSGHTNTVSTVAMSPKGTYIGSGQINHIGFKASTKLWDFKKKTMIGTHELHKVRVEALCFSSDERYMISLGGRDDGCVVLWNCVAGAATGTAAASKLTTGDAMTLVPLSLRVNSFVTGGDSNLRVWNIGCGSKSLDVADVSLGKLRRCVRCLAVSRDDAYGVAGTTCVTTATNTTTTTTTTNTTITTNNTCTTRSSTHDTFSIDVLCCISVAVTQHYFWTLDVPHLNDEGQTHCNANTCRC